ncbi:hypothetical protein [Ruegeria denitrificans]|uniref:hypothetical protein n=1 Tax=Ruegeria denitrificans TaxID=1715692 RepID=UPI00071CDCBD|nr:hypothetical protein [Ruegeria denitrificans]
MEFLDHISTALADFTNPKKRIFVGYLFLTVLIAFVWLVAARRSSMRAALREVFDRKILFSPLRSGIGCLDRCICRKKTEA